MKYYSKENVYEASKRRIRELFEDFPNVVVAFSGGKDSVVVFHLALEVAEELGRLPLPVLFIDQEAEWQSTIDVVREVMYDPKVKPYWIQVPFKMFSTPPRHKTKKKPFSTLGTRTKKTSGYTRKTLSQSKKIHTEWIDLAKCTTLL